MSSQGASTSRPRARRRSVPDDDVAEQARFRFAYVIADIRLMVRPAMPRRTIRGSAPSWRSRGMVQSHLEHRGEIVACRPVLAELPPSNSIPVALLGHEAFVGRRREATELAKVGPRGADADGDHVGVGDDRLSSSRGRGTVPSAMRPPHGRAKGPGPGQAPPGRMAPPRARGTPRPRCRRRH